MELLFCIGRVFFPYPCKDDEIDVVPVGFAAWFQCCSFLARLAQDGAEDAARHKFMVSLKWGRTRRKAWEAEDALSSAWTLSFAASVAFCDTGNGPWVFPFWN